MIRHNPQGDSSLDRPVARLETMPRNTIANILTQAVKPSRFWVMVKKVRKRFFDEYGDHSRAANRRWLAANCSSFEAVATDLAPDLWRESQRVSAAIERRGNEILDEIDHQLGGGACYPFLYFLTRFFKPRFVVETGVAAGFSSYAFLMALEANGRGRLFSSDFPYFRLPDPEKYIGVVVPRSLEERWTLYIDGDDANLPRILDSVDHVDLFHYDSDKSYAGRRSAMMTIEGHLSEDAIVMMDDVGDNAFFYDYVESNDIENWNVFEFRGKYVGVIGDLLK